MNKSLRDVLAEAGLASERVVLMRHAPSEKEQPRFRRGFIDLAYRDRALFEFYQSYQTPRTTKKIGAKGYLMSALPGPGTQTILYAIYKILGQSRSITADELMAELPMQRLLERGLKPLSCPKYSIIDFERTQLLHELSGRVAFEWPWAAVNWCGLAPEEVLSTTLVHETSVLGKDRI